ncbi:MAG TPA: hypothetical protein VKE51_07880 [Vicinamibacterales bacterium]|nr:hypothetical protein [Vicinamibacterales bacterium]
MTEPEGEAGVLDPVEVAPLVTALRRSTGETRVTILEALVRLPLTPAVADEVGVPFAPPEGSPMRPLWAEGKRLGFASYPASAPRKLERPSWGWGGLKKVSPVLDDELAPAAVTRWFEWAVGDVADIGLANEIVGWIGECQGSFHPDLEGLFVQYRRAALAECAAWSDGRRPGGWFLRDPDFESWRGYRVLCWQIGWTVSRGGLRGLATGLVHWLAADDETDRVVAALLIADAADFVLQAHPAMFGGGRGPAPRPPVGSADVSRLPHLLREAARAGIVPEPRALETGADRSAVGRSRAPALQRQGALLHEPAALSVGVAQFVRPREAARPRRGSGPTARQAPSRPAKPAGRHPRRADQTVAALVQ